MTGNKLTDLVNKYIGKNGGYNSNIVKPKSGDNGGNPNLGLENRLINAVMDVEPEERRPRISNFERKDLPKLAPVPDMYEKEVEGKRDQGKLTDITRRMQETVKRPDNELFDPSMTNQPSYETDQTQILNDIASDESVPALIHNISTLSRLGVKAKARLIARTIAFQSKNQVFSNITSLNDYQAAQDDFEYAQILSKGDFTSFDVNSDYFTAEAIMEAQFNIRLRRSRNALNLQQINTQRSEQVFAPQHNQPEERKLRNRIPIIGSSF